MTPNYLFEMKMIEKKGKWGNQKAKNGIGYTSLRETHQFYDIGREKRLDTFWARHPSWGLYFFTYKIIYKFSFNIRLYSISCMRI